MIHLNKMEQCLLMIGVCLGIIFTLTWNETEYLVLVVISWVMNIIALYLRYDINKMMGSTDDRK